MTEYPYGQTMPGIMESLTKQGRTVTVTAQSSNATAKLLLDRRFAYRSSPTPGQWVCFNFGQLEVRVTHYVFQALPMGRGPANWELQGRKEGASWVSLDRKEGVDYFARGNSARVLLVSAEIPVNQIRIKMIGTEGINLRFVEFYGAVTN
jgi:hypothetical protein